MGYVLKGCKLDTSRVSEIATYSPNEPFRITLDRNKNHTLVRARLEVKYTPGTSPAAAEDGVAKLLKGVAIQINRGVKLMEVIDGQQLVLYSRHLNRGRGANDQPGTTGGTAYVDMFFNIPADPVHPENPVVAIPGQNDDIVDVDLIGTWGNDSDLGTDYTVDSALLSVVEDRGWVCPSDKVSEYFPIATRVMPNWYYGNYSFTGAVGNFGLGINLNSRVAIRNIFIIAKDDNGNRSDDVITEFALKRYDNINILGPVNFKDWQRYKAQELDMDPEKGCMLIDLRKDVATTAFTTKQGLVLPRDGDVRLVFSTSGAGSVTYLFDAVMSRTATI